MNGNKLDDKIDYPGVPGGIGRALEIEAFAKSSIFPSQVFPWFLHVPV